jgi:hypothetical protein
MQRGHGEDNRYIFTALLLKRRKEHGGLKTESKIKTGKNDRPFQYVSTINYTKIIGLTN